MVQMKISTVSMYACCVLESNLYPNLSVVSYSINVSVSYHVISYHIISSLT